MRVKIDDEFARKFILDHDGMAKYAADEGAAEAILVRKLITAHGGEAALGDGLFPGRDVAVILRVGALNTATSLPGKRPRSEEHTSELQSHHDLVCRLLLEKKKKKMKK